MSRDGNRGNDGANPAQCCAHTFYIRIRSLAGMTDQAGRRIFIAFMHEERQDAR